jgi:hypothetical protein
MALENGGGATVALEDGGHAAALGVGVGRQFKIVGVALGGGGGRRTCNNGVGISIVKAKGLLLQRQHQHWQGGQERTCTMQRMYINSNGKEIGVSRKWWRWCGCEDGAGKARARGRWHGIRPAQVRQGQCTNGIAKELTGERENG